MKKVLTFIVAMALTLVTCFSLTACGGKNGKTDWEYIENKGTMVVGYTLYDPFAYKDSNDKLIGFDVELAEAVADKLDIKVEFQEIDWDAKVTELNGLNIDVIWNAMTITDTLKESIDISTAYCKNNQAVVVKSGDETKYATKDLIKSSGDKITFESGSSAQAVVEADSILSTVQTTPANSQVDALTEVASGTTKIAIVDVLLYDSLKAKDDSIVSKNNLVKVDGITFPAEEFGIGFRKNSDFKAKVEEALATLKTEGKYAEIAAKYNLTNNLV